MTNPHPWWPEDKVVVEEFFIRRDAYKLGLVDEEGFRIYVSRGAQVAFKVGKLYTTQEEWAKLLHAHREGKLLDVIPGKFYSAYLRLPLEEKANFHVIWDLMAARAWWLSPIPK